MKPDDEIRRLKLLLRDLERFYRDVEKCSAAGGPCVAPADAFERRHATQWKALRARVVELGRDADAEKAPN